MKFNKSTIAAIVVALVSKSSLLLATTIYFPPSYQFEKLDFSLVASQQAYTEAPVSTNYSGTNLTQTTVISAAVIKNSKITSKDLLSFLATAFNTNWPKGAQLALENWSGDIFVVDKTGTNPVYDVSIGIDMGDSKTVYFNCSPSGYGVYTDQLVDPNHNRNHISYKQTRYSKWFFHLFSEQNGYASTDLSFDGLDTTDFYAAENNITIQSDAASVTGAGYINWDWTVITGHVTGSGKWYCPPAVISPSPMPPLLGD